MQIQEGDEDKPKPAAILNNSDQFAAQIALPEGHQITIGELDPGTLVEIATWHGTGRPDESANRFLLSAEGIGLTRRQSDRSQVRAVPRPTPRPEVRFNEQQVGKQSYLPPQSSNSGLSDLTGFHPINNDPFIQDPEQSENPWSERIKTAGFTALVFILIGVIFQVYGLAVTVPDQGPRTFLGSTTTSLVIYKKTKEVISGNVMVVKVKTGEQTTTYFGAGSINGDQLTLGLEGKNITLRTQDVAGKGFFLVPIAGAIIKNIGALIN